MLLHAYCKNGLFALQAFDVGFEGLDVVAASLATPSSGFSAFAHNTQHSERIGRCISIQTTYKMQIHVSVRLFVCLCVLPNLLLLRICCFRTSVLSAMQRLLLFVRCVRNIS